LSTSHTYLVGLAVIHNYLRLRRYTYITVCLTTILVLTTLTFISIAQPEGSGSAVLIKLTTTVDGGAVSLIERGISELRPGELLIIEINTYGGYLAAADKIVELLGKVSNCVAWVTPGGKAVSAGSLIALACGNVFMGPNSVIGAARPTPADEKVVNYVRGRFRAVAERAYSSNETLINIAERFVTENLVLTASEASKLGIAKYVSSFDELLNELGVNVRESVIPGPWEYLISLISTPLISSLMFWVGFMLIFIEVLTTGFQGYVIPGVLLILLALYGMYLIPVSVIALAVLISGLVLIVVEIYQPGFGVFGISGIALSALGAYLILASEPYAVLTSIHYAVISGLLVFLGFVSFIAYEALKVRKVRRRGYREKLIGSVGRAKTDIHKDRPGVVYVLNEEWTAFSIDEPIRAGEEVVVVDVKGLKLYVKKKS